MALKTGLFFVVSILLSFAVNAADSNCQQHQCIAVVDAGSTGSRLHIYAYDLDKTNTAINIKEFWTKKIKPGLATIEANQATLDAYLTTLFADAPGENIPVYFYATAGMRLLSQPKQQQFYVLMKKWFANQFKWKLRCAKTINGIDEGLFGWLTVNYELGTLNTEDKPSIGVMDMGGASVQIMFPVEKMDGIKNNDVRQLDLYGRHLTLFIHSFLGLGQTEVSHQFLDFPPCFSDNYELPTGFPAFGDAYSCEIVVSSLMNNVHHVNTIIQPVIAANPVNNWFVMGGMAELAKSQPFQFDNYQFTNQTLLEQADTQICHQQWSILNQQYPNNEYLYGYCLFSSYYYALMVDGYGMPPQQPVNYMTANQSSDWTLGVVLHQQPVNLKIEILPWK